MTRTTIDIGIDLGTTNSSIAVLNGTAPEVIRNNENHDCTPSVVWVRDTQHAPIVGERAKDRLEYDPQNTKAEFKLVMGSAEPYRFERIGRELLPEELSAEVLRSLKGDARQRLNEEVAAAVVCVPAKFKLPQREATRRAAGLAGFETCVLLQEPVAAGLAYGFQHHAANLTWLVYDIGGGTFDAAVLRLHEGELTVIGHGGDEHLGGAIIDRKIVDELFVPALLHEYPLPDFTRENAHWLDAFAQMRQKAEQAKIRLSRVELEEVAIEFGEVFYEYELRRSDIARLAEPLITQSIRTCKNVLAAAGLGRHDIERVLLVGGPTLMPYVVERLTDPKEGLGIPLANSVDPMTVVARGAAIFAGTQRLERPLRSTVVAGSFQAHLDYQPIGPSDRPVVCGRIEAHRGAAIEGFSVELIRQGKSSWRSQRLLLNSTGEFRVELLAERGERNVYRLVLYDQAGTTHPVEPGELGYTIGLVSAEQRVSNSIGVAMSDNRVDVLIESGRSFPCSASITHEIAMDIEAHGDVDLYIPLVEGDDMQRADRNRLIGGIRLPASQLRDDLLKGTEVRLAVEIDESGTMNALAAIPSIGARIPCENARRISIPGQSELQDAVTKEKERLEDVRGRIGKLGSSDAERQLSEIEAQGIVSEMDGALAASRGDAAVALECENRLLSLRRALDDVEQILALPDAIRTAAEAQAKAESRVSAHGSEEDEKLLDALVAQLDDAIAAEDTEEIVRIGEELATLDRDLLWEQPSTYYWFLDWLVQRQHRMRDKHDAAKLFGYAFAAKELGDVPRLQRACWELFVLLPEAAEDGAPIPGYGGVTQRKRD